MKKKIGLIVNPIAGMGGSVGLKGTDGEMHKKALELGAEPISPTRTKDLFSHLKGKEHIALFVAPGKMGEAYIQGTAIAFTVIGNAGGETSVEDTKRIAKQMLSEGIELLIVVGGDGTARDIYDVVGLKVPVVAVPSGVKIFSSVFASSARAAAGLVDAFLKSTEVTEEEVLDIDEQAFREGRLDSKLYGYLLVPDYRTFLQAGKESSGSGKSTAESKKEIARYIVSAIDKNTLYLLGPGTTVKAVADEIGVSKTLLGVDSVADGRLTGEDLNERGILDQLGQYEKRKMIITPLGGNGFIFGRGNKQFSPEVIRKVGRENLIVVGTIDKLNKLEALRVDTGDFELDELLSGYIEVITCYKEGIKMEVRC